MKNLATILFIAVAVVATVFLSLVLTEKADDKLVRLYRELAVNRVRTVMIDPNAKVEDVVFHPVPGDGPEGRSYACGYVRSSLDTHAQPQRFIYYFSGDTVSIFGRLPRDIVESSTRLCNAIPISFDRIDTAGGKMSLKAHR